MTYFDDCDMPQRGIMVTQLSGYRYVNYTALLSNKEAFFMGLSQGDWHALFLVVFKLLIIISIAFGV